MTTISISQLKTNPSKIIEQSSDYPVAVEKRNEVKAYLVGKDLFEKIISHMEDYLDKKAVRDTDFRKGRKFEEIAADLGI